MNKSLKLFVWEGCFKEWTMGLAVVLASDSEEARDLLREKIGYEHMDLGTKPTVYELDNPVAFYVHGGS